MKRKIYENALADFGDKFMNCFKETMKNMQFGQGEVEYIASNDVGPCKVEGRFERLIFPLPNAELMTYE